MRLIGLGTVAAMLLAGCVNNIEAETKPINDGRVIALAKTLIADRMRDPEATRFKNEFSSFQTKQGDYIVCGSLNAKNAMGGYVGYRQFYARIRNNSLEAFNIPGDDDEYGIVTNAVAKSCRDAAAGKVTVGS